MNLKKLAIATAITAALGGASGIASAAITGVPGEASLGPMVLSSDANGFIETYIGLYVPTQIGNDTVITQYTAPNTAGQTQVLDDPRIHWTLYDQNSNKVEDGACEVSPGDYVLWTTDWTVQQVQQQQRAALDAAGFTGLYPDPVCGPSSPTRFGYVVFETAIGADGLAADFAFWAHAGIADNANLGIQNGQNVASVPMMPMADSADDGISPFTGAPFGPLPQLANEVISQNPNDGIEDDPAAYAPIATGIRMNDADGTLDDIRIAAPIQGPQAAWGQSLHVFWFDRNDEDRVAQTRVWDDHEGSCSDTVPLPRELNLILYNNDVTIPAFAATPPNWTNIGAFGVFNAAGAPGTPNRYTDVISAVQPANPLGGYRSGIYCTPQYWLPNAFGITNYNGAFGGYVQYEIDEIGEDPAAGANPNGVNSAAVAFNWQEVIGGAQGTVIGSWTSHMSTALGNFPF